jgi:hypothetical protein
MTPKQRLQSIGIAAAVLVIVFGLGYWQGQRKVAAIASQSENAANVAKGEADALKRQAQAQDAEIAAKDAGLEAARADVVRKVAELAKIKASLHTYDPVGPILPSEPVQPGVVDLAPLVAKQDEVIQAQSYFIKGLETKIVDLTISRDWWKDAEGARSREAAGLRIALETQKALTKGALWKGRIQGLAVGIASGYVYGRR